ncbi:gamma carbonic anhydrase family protein [Tissierella sp. Yu-01]|uniref:gamma carbonic anhydrase family protein n=1 Tax=Tissierella sp. Yu-01 TaxID=3035694 RepID=UPI00240D5AD3|nr:gamma carbonic anhydrase family protein [Tissierella sp. Yu-01]WFA09961.1 gamma carbonic anhydrase family protein [Tissierella sp. Yu-01]
MIKDLNGITPRVHEDAFVAETASVLGEVTIGEGSSIWYGAVLRGDIAPITIGKFSNVQDNATVHNETNIPAKIGDYTVVGHNAIVHGCTIGNNCLIGMGAIILNGAVIGDNCIIGAGTLITERKEIPPNSMVIGTPGKVIRMVTEEELEKVRKNAMRYSELWRTKHI